MIDRVNMKSLVEVADSVTMTNRDSLYMYLSDKMGRHIEDSEIELACHDAGRVAPPDWYERRHELRPDMIFRTHDGVVMLDRRVPGDGTQWYVADWFNGWSYEDSTIEPGELGEQLAHDWKGVET